MGTNSLAVVGHVGPGFSGGTMAAPHALAALAALGQPTRLAIFRLLVRKEPTGLSAGALAEAVGCPHNTLSTHIAILARAGLVKGAREGRTITYRADAVGMSALIRSWSLIVVMAVPNCAACRGLSKKRSAAALQLQLRKREASDSGWCQ